MDTEIRRDLADQLGRNVGVVSPGFPEKMARRLRRKFGVKLAAGEIAGLLDDYASIFVFAASALKECLLPVRGEYAGLADIDDPKYMAAIGRQFPAEDPEVLKNIAGWAVYYGYLR